MRHLTGSVLLAMALVAGACTSSPDPTTTTTTLPTTTTTTAPPTTTTTAPATTTTLASAAYGGTAVIGLASQPETLNPFFSDDPEVQLIAETWTVGVHTVSGETGGIIPDVVTELPTVSNGGVIENLDGTITVTYQIEPAATWADGVPVSGADFQFTLETILDPGLSIPKGIYADILSSTVDDKSFSYTLAFPTIEFTSLFGVILPEHDVAGSDFAADWNQRAWVAGGPFTLDRWVADQQILMNRNANYWKQDEDGVALPYLDGVSFEIIADPTARFDAVTSGAVHATWADGTLDDPTQYDTVTAAGASVVTVAGPVWVHLNFQFGPDRWDRNPDSLNEYLSFRQGVMHAIDRQRIATELFGDRAVPLDSYVSVYHASVSGNAWAQYDYDPAKAADLIDSAVNELRASNPEAPSAALVFFTTNASNTERVRTAELIGEMLTEAGADYLDTSENSITFFGETVGSGRFDLSMWAWQAANGLGPLVRFHDVLDPGDERSLTNFYRWGTEDSSINDPFTRRFLTLLLLMRDEVDQDQVSLIIQEAEQIAANQAVFLPLYAEPMSAVFWPDVIDGFTLNAAAPFTWNVETWILAGR